MGGGGGVGGGVHWSRKTSLKAESPLFNMFFSPFSTNFYILLIIYYPAWTCFWTSGQGCHANIKIQLRLKVSA